MEARQTVPTETATEGNLISIDLFPIGKLMNTKESIVIPATMEVPENGWQTQPAAAQLVLRILESACQQCPWLETLRVRMLAETGTRLFDWIDHIAVPAHVFDERELGGFDVLQKQLLETGFVQQEVSVPEGGRLTANSGASETYWVQPQGIFPKLVAHRDVTKLRVTLKVDCVSDFLVAHQLQDCIVEGQAGGRMQKSLVMDNGSVEVYIVARRGWPLWRLPQDSDKALVAAGNHFQRIRCRSRSIEQDFAFSDSLNRMEQAAADLGQDWTCWLHFEAERVYWQSRNNAARVQKQRQDVLGLGWANHDHHTYRCSREYFARVIQILETIGMRCRERFYAGEQAGWGAQVLEQPVVGIVVFADVDLLPEELSGDFAHEEFQPLDKMGTVGLWCMLHGDSMSGAGLHHLECQFDFVAAREQLEAHGVGSMSPFTDFDHLKQSFTAPELWPVDSRRLSAALSSGALSEQQASEIKKKGAIGSHLEVLERNDGFKGFNQHGISDIIAKTDPRKILSSQ